MSGKSLEEKTRLLLGWPTTSAKGGKMKGRPAPYPEQSPRKHALTPPPSPTSTQAHPVVSPAEVGPFVDYRSD